MGHLLVFAMVSRPLSSLLLFFGIEFTNYFDSENHPTALYIYAFPPPSRRCEELDKRIQPYLLSIVMLSSAITLVSWKPRIAAAKNQDMEITSTLAILASQGQSIHLWNHQSDHKQIVEAVPIPIGKRFFFSFPFFLISLK